MLHKSSLFGSLFIKNLNLISKCSSSSISSAAPEIKSWKEKVVQQPLATSPEDLKRNHKLYNGGFYVNHRLFVDKLPDKYTIKPFKTLRTGGRDLETKERLFRRVGGGLPIEYYWVDFKRVGPKSGPPLEEKVIDILRPKDRTAFIALVAHANQKRYILATENMNIGDIVRTSSEIPKNPVVAHEGDAFPVGALPLNTMVHNIEPTPGSGGKWCHAAGSHAFLVRKIDDRCIIKLPNNNEISIDQHCMVTVGQVSHASHKDEKLTSAVDLRDLGYRPRSGLWQRKGPRFGRKIRAPKPLLVVGENVSKESKRIPYEYQNWSLTE